MILPLLWLSDLSTQHEAAGGLPLAKPNLCKKHGSENMLLKDETDNCFFSHGLLDFRSRGRIPPCPRVKPSATTLT